MLLSENESGGWGLAKSEGGSAVKGEDKLKKIFSRTSFFWLVNLIFMGVSVLHAGDFFGITGKDDFARYLGFAVSFFLDLVTIILMQAMLEARYRGEEHRARQFLFFIVLCCGTSTFANLAISLNDFEPTRYLPHAPIWVQIATPYILASFPLFVIMMSIAAEMIINVRPLEQLDEQEYEASEAKRLKIMEIRNTYLQKQVKQELLAIQIRNQMLLNKRQRMSAFSWPWQRRSEPPVVDIDAIKDSLRDELDADYRGRIDALQQRVDAMRDEQCDEQCDEQLESLFRRPISDEMAAFQVYPELSTESTQDDAEDEELDIPDEQSVAPIELDSRRATNPLQEQEQEPETNPPLASARMTRKLPSSDSGMLKKARRHVLRNEHITAQELGDKLGISRSYAGKLKTQILRAKSESDSAS